MYTFKDCQLPYVFTLIHFSMRPLSVELFVCLKLSVNTKTNLFGCCICGHSGHSFLCTCINLPYFHTRMVFCV